MRRAVAAMVRKDVRRRWRSPLGVLAALAFPLLFATLIGLAFGRGAVTPKIAVLVSNDDDGPLGGFLVGALASERTAEFLVVTEIERGGPEQLESTGAAALLQIPETFSDDLLAGTPTALRVTRNPAQGIFPEVVEQLAGVLVEALDTGSHALRGPLARIHEFSKSDGSPPDDALIAMTLDVRDAVDGVSDIVFPPVVRLEVGDDAGGAGSGGGPTGPGALFLAFLPGVSVYAMFLLGDLGMRDLLVELEDGTLRRQLAGPVGAGTMLAGKAAFTMLLAAAGLVVLVATGAGFVESVPDPAGFLALSMALVLGVTGTASVIYGATGTQRSGSSLAGVAFLVLAFLGGAFTAQSLPPAIERVAPISPFWWGTDGYRLLLREGANLADVRVHVAVLAGLGLASLALGSWLLGRRVRTGAA